MLRTSPRLEAVVQRTAGEQGPLYYADLGDCGGIQWVDYRWNTVKAPAAGSYVVRARCAHPQTWSLAVGLLGRPVATVRYRQPSPPTATPTPTSSGVTLDFPPAVSSVRIHIGQKLTLRVPLVNTSDPSAGPSWIARADAQYLQLLAAGPLPDGSRYVYRWRALAAGNTVITLDPACLQHGCAVPSFALRVRILP
jgi:hypothetical protein